MELSLPGSIGVFAASAVVIWIAGTRISRHARTLGEHGIGQAIVGSVVLGAIVSLPEMVVAIAACAIDSPELGVNTLLGGIGFSILALAITDLAVGREPLSSDITHPVVLLEGTLVVILLAITAAGLIVGDRPIAGAGAWTIALFALYLASVPVIRRYERSRPWVAAEQPTAGTAARTGDGRAQTSLRAAIAHVAVGAVAIVVAGTALAFAADAIARDTGLGASFVGFVLGGLATSLPELSTTIAAVRLQQFEMAFSDAFGTNLVSVMLLFVVDLVYAGGPVLDQVGRFSLLATVLGIVLTAIYLAGFVERKKRGALRMGWDSIAVFAVAIVGLILLYQVRG